MSKDHSASVARSDPERQVAPMGEQPRRVQLSRARGWKMPPNTVSVARPARWGNPFEVDLVGRDRAVSAFRELLDGFFSGPSFRDLTDDQFSRMYDQVAALQKRHGGLLREAARWDLRGKNLACWCRPGEPCHADVLLELANAPSEPQPRDQQVPGESSRETKQPEDGDSR